MRHNVGIDFFDVDHTLTHGSTGRHFVMLGVKVGLFPWRNIVQIPMFYLKYRYGGMRTNKPFERNFPGLKGTSRQYLEEVAQLCFEKKLKPDFYADARQLIQEMKDRGRRVVLATSSIDIIVQPLAEWLGVELIASSLEFDGDQSTGRFLDMPVFKQEKRRLVMELISQSGHTPENCSFYSDSIHDLPLLESVGHPVAANPDRRLRKEAHRRGWQILDFELRKP